MNTLDVWDRRVIVLVFALFLWRLGYLFLVPLDLAPDEAYYWDWSRRLAWCYYSKPPMVAWAMALSTGLLGSTAFAVRLPAVIFGIVGLWFLYLLGKRIYGAKAGFFAVLAWIATPGSSALGLIMTIDAPLVAFWSLALYSLWRALENGGGDSRWWVLSSLATGLGILSKPTMLAFLPLLPLFLWLSPLDRRLFHKIRPYAFMACSLLALIPILWWNNQNDWVTFHHGGQHFSTGQKGFSLSAITFFKFLGSQLGLISPITWSLIAGVSVLCILRQDRKDRSIVYTAVFCAIPLAGILLLSLRQGVHGNWPAPFYLTGFILLGAWKTGELSCGLRFDRLRILFFPGLILGAFFAMLIYVLPFLMNVTSLRGGNFDATVRVRGWQDMGKEVGTVWQGMQGREKMFLLSTRRQFVSALAFYMPDQPRVYHWPSRAGRVESQYEVWGGPTDKIGWDSLIVTDTTRGLPDDLRSVFEKVEPLGEVNIPLGENKNRQILLYRGYLLRNWPEKS